LDEAEKLQVEVILLRKEILGEHHPNTITASNTLAATYYLMGRLNEAKTLQEEILKMRAKVLGDRHPYTVDAMVNLAITYDKLRRKPEALDRLTMAEVIISETLGKEHPRYRRCQRAKSAARLDPDAAAGQLNINCGNESVAGGSRLIWLTLTDFNLRDGQN
jgi:hypothetical protein